MSYILNEVSFRTGTCEASERSEHYVGFSMLKFKKVLASTSLSLFLLLSHISVPLLPPEASLLSLFESSSSFCDLVLFVGGGEDQSLLYTVGMHDFRKTCNVW